MKKRTIVKFWAMSISIWLVLMGALVACSSAKTATPVPSPTSKPAPKLPSSPTLTPSPLPAPGSTPAPSIIPTPSLAPAPQPAIRVKAKWIKPEISGDSASVSVNEVWNNKISHFGVGTSAGDITFMVYQLEGKLYARADICPPCRSESFSLKSDRLVCDVCGTVFDARTGAGISGGCVIFPKAPVPFETSNGKMVMKANDLITAYQETLKPN